MNEEMPIEELAEQFLERRRKGEALDAHAFVAEHPQYADELEGILQLMMDMEQLAPAQSKETTSLPELPDADYKLVRRLGRGGMGEVFEAIQLSLNRKVAVKVLDFHLLANSEQRTQFENEAKVIAMLHHPNIVKIHSAGCSEKCCYYTMELIDGNGLGRQRFDDLRELARVALQAAQALAYAHSCGVLHRDVKPSNMLLDRQGNVHISDFGIAFILNEAEPMLEKGDSRSGTLRYMAPERVSRGINTFATDQYSFGVAMYELVTGTPAIKADSADELRERIGSVPLPPLVCKEPDFAAIINKCIRFDPAERYSDMNEVAEDLRRFLQHEPVRAASASLPRRFSLWCRRKPAVAALSFASIFCATAFVVSLSVGYIRTKAALWQAEQNAATADASLTRIFTRISEQPPSTKNTELLSDLLPYYQMIAVQRNLPAEQLCDAYEVIGECAERIGNYPLAVSAFQRMMELRSDAYPMNRLATALKRQGNSDESERMSRQVIGQFRDSAEENDRFEVVRALLAVSSEPDSEERKEAFRILEALLKEHPDNPEYRFQYALLLDGNPKLYHSLLIPGVESNATVLLIRLVEEHPGNPEYSLGLLRLLLGNSRITWMFKNRREALDKVLQLSEDMLRRWPNDPQIVASVVELHSRHIDMLRRNNERINKLKENERLLSILEFLFYIPDNSDAVKEELIRLQLRKLKVASSHEMKDELEYRRRKIRKELQHYHGPKLEEFRKQLEEAK